MLGLASLLSSGLLACTPHQLGRTTELPGELIGMKRARRHHQAMPGADATGCPPGSPRFEGVGCVEVPTMDRIEEAYALFDRGVEAYAAGDYPGAVAWFTAADTVLPFHMDLVYDLGMAHLRNGNCGAAQRHFETVTIESREPRPRKKAQAQLDAIAASGGC